MSATIGAIACAGHVVRAEALADSLGHPVEGLAARVAILDRMAAMGDLDSVRRLVPTVADGLRVLIEAPPWQSTFRTGGRRLAHVLGKVIVACAAAGDRPLARRVADQVLGQIEVRQDWPDPWFVDPEWLVQPFARIGDLDGAESLARHETGDTRRAALFRVVGPALDAGEHDRARRLIEEIVRDLPEPASVAMLAALAREVAAGGHHEQAVALLDRTEARARRQGDPTSRAQLLASLTRPAAITGAFERVESLAVDACELAVGPELSAILVKAATVVAGAGDHQRAARLALLAESQARHLDEVWERVATLLDLLHPLLDTDESDRVRRVAAAVTSYIPRIEDPALRCNALSWLIEPLVAVGDGDHALRLAGTAERCATELDDPNEQQQALADLVEPVAATGDLAWAERLATGLFTPEAALNALYGVLTAASQRPDRELVRRLVAEVKRRTLNSQETNWATYDDSDEIIDEYVSPWKQRFEISSLVWPIAAAGELDTAEELARQVSPKRYHDNPWSVRSRYLAQVARCAADSDRDRAERLVRELTAPVWPDPDALVDLAYAVAALGDAERAHGLARSAEDHVRRFSNPWPSDDALAELSGLMLEVGDLERAEALARDLRDDSARAAALAAVAEFAIRHHAPDLARRLVAELVATWDWPVALRPLAALDQTAICALTDALLDEQT